MIRVQLAPEPRPPGFDFDREVRQRGLSAIAELVGQPPTIRRPGPRIAPRAASVAELSYAELRAYPYWTAALDALHAAYRGICAYTCFYIEPLAGPTVDHFVALARMDRPDLAYEWSNFRLACLFANIRKGARADVLDPFEIEDGWFELDLALFCARPAAGLPPPLQERVRATIQRLGLDSREYRDMNRRYFEGYYAPEAGRPRVSLEFLETQAPFLAREIRRQGRVRSEDRPAPVDSSP